MRIGIGLWIGAAGGSGGGAPSLTDGNAALRLDGYVADATWSRPTLGEFWGLTGTVNRARVDLWAPGAGGTTNTGGGGGGAYARADDLDVSGSASYGIAGLAGAAANTNSTDATFGTTLVVADGALSAGNGGTGGQASASTGDAKFDGGNGQIATGTRIGGAGAGSAGSAVTSTAGAPNGGGVVSGAIGRQPGAGGGSLTAGEFAGCSGMARVFRQVIGTTGYARWRGVSEARQTGGTTLAVNVSSGMHVGGAPAAGDRLLLICGSDVSEVMSVGAWGSTLLDDANSTNVRMTIFERAATGDASDDVTITTGVASRTSAIMLRISDAAAAEGTIANSASAANADPPSHTRTGGGGAATNGLWITAVTWDSNAASASQNVTAPPAGYSNWMILGAVSNAGVGMSIAMREANAATENPGAFTSDAEQYVAATVLVAPA